MGNHSSRANQSSMVAWTERDEEDHDPDSEMLIQTEKEQRQSFCMITALQQLSKFSRKHSACTCCALLFTIFGLFWTGQRETCGPTRVDFDNSSWNIDPAARCDPAVMKYPEDSTVEVQNALFLAARVKEVLNISDFHVTRNGHHVGYLPILYLGFPKHGTTSAYSMIGNSIPCMIHRAGKEPWFLRTFFRPDCTADQAGRLLSCNATHVAERISRYLQGGGQLQPEATTDENVLAQHCHTPVWIDGSSIYIWSRKLALASSPWNGPTINLWPDGMVPFDPLVFIRELAPKSRFLALGRDWAKPLLRSSWFYFRRDFGEPLDVDAYKQDLKSNRDAIVQALADEQSRCKIILREETFKHFPLSNWWASSCNMGMVEALFTKERIFFADVADLVECKTDFFPWLWSFLHVDLGIPESMADQYGGKCRPLPQGRTVQNARTDTKDREVEGRPDIVLEEDAYLHILRSNFFPLLRAGV